MKIRRIQKGLVLVTLTTGVLAAGCELIVDFDRTKIPVEISEASIPDVVIPETSTPTPEAGADADATAPDADASEPDAADAADATDQ